MICDTHKHCHIINLNTGYDFDALVVDVDELDGRLSRTPFEKLEQFLYDGDDRDILARYSRGSLVEKPFTE